MQILLSAYDFAPEAGSESGRAWRYASGLAAMGHEVTVLSSAVQHRDEVERWVQNGGRLPDGLSLAWHDPPDRNEPEHYSGNAIRHHYLRWQSSAPPVVRHLHERSRFDVIHHCGWAAFRWPTLLGGIAPRTVFGPVGGGATAPWGLRRGMNWPAWRHEILRDLANLWARMDPRLHRALERVDQILVCDQETLASIPAWLRDRAVPWPDIFVPGDLARSVRAPRGDGPLRALVACRQELWKGVHLAVHAVRRCLDAGLAIELHVAGTGPHAALIQALAVELDLGSAVQFLGPVPHRQMPELLSSHDVFLSPSMHDTGPLVVGEALHQGLPVICLDVGGARHVVDDRCGFVVPTGHRGRSVVEADIAAALMRYGTEPELLAQHSEAAYACADSMGIEQRLRTLVDSVYRTARAPSGAPATEPAMAMNPGG